MRVTQQLPTAGSAPSALQRSSKQQSSVEPPAARQPLEIKFVASEADLDAWVEQEVRAFCEVEPPTRAERQQQEEAFAEVKAAVAVAIRQHATCVRYGSSMSGLSLSTSDVDVGIVGEQ
jgi:hypothetical protein